MCSVCHVATSKNLSISHTCCRRRKSKQWTWKSPDGKVKKEIDYILIKRSIALNSDVIQKVNTGSDHSLIWKAQSQLGSSHRKDELQIKLQSRSEKKPKTKIKTWMKWPNGSTRPSWNVHTKQQEETARTRRKSSKTIELQKKTRDKAEKQQTARKKIEYTELCKTIGRP
ncbi:uncharacterized protein LOC125040181 [Penaeus chinensis]|uniref:uncharacterized protein LOC125040181 n=1 Tax=Penaeus chinensis TaxID=139456 RepID=UPI001FB753C1|nr:uncharacterized protein LOC125040181 [Penaeus chinensis]